MTHQSKRKLQILGSTLSMLLFLTMVGFAYRWYQREQSQSPNKIRAEIYQKGTYAENRPIYCSPKKFLILARWRAGRRGRRLSTHIQHRKKVSGDTPSSGRMLRRKKVSGDTPSSGRMLRRKKVSGDTPSSGRMLR